MVLAVPFLFLYLNVLINADGNQSSSPLNPGISACKYTGDKVGFGYCDKTPMSVKKLSSDCTSFFYEGLEFTEESKVEPIYFPNDKKRIGELIDAGKPVYVTYQRKNLSAWNEAIDKENVDFGVEIKALKELVKDYPITGLVLDKIVEDNLIVPKDFNVNLKKYVGTLKTIPDLQIGLNIDARSIISNKKLPSLNEWLDFKMLNDAIDFYVIDFIPFNPCSEIFLKTGTIPMDGEMSNTLSKFFNNFNKTVMPKDKIYYQFLVSPTVPTNEGLYCKNCYGSIDKGVKASGIICDICDEDNSGLFKYPPCYVSYSQICQDASMDWCADNSNTLREKGKLAKDHGAGFVAANIDSIDRHLVCGCGKYVSFDFMVDGWNERNDRTCPKLDRQP